MGGLELGSRVRADRWKWRSWFIMAMSSGEPAVIWLEHNALLTTSIRPVCVTYAIGVVHRNGHFISLPFIQYGIRRM